MTFDLDLWPFDHMNIWRFPYHINKPSLVQIGLGTFQMRPFSHFQPILQLDLRWPLMLVNDIWPHEHMKVPISYHINKPNLVPIGLQLFKWGHFHILVHLTTWPQMTFDLDMWLLISSTNEGFHVASMTQLWLKSIKSCGSEMSTCFYNNRHQTTDNNNNRGQSDHYVSFLLRQATQKLAYTWHTPLKLCLIL